MINRARMILGFAIAPLTMAIFFSFYSYLYDGYVNVFQILFHAGIGYYAALLFGLPLYLLLFEPRGWRSPILYALFGAAIGYAAYLIPTAAILIPAAATAPESRIGLLHGLIGPWAAIGIFFGAVSALVFWLIAIWRAPEDSA